MPSKLTALLNKIDPKYTYDKISASIDDAINSFDLKSNIVTDLHDFQEICANFYCHIENIVFGFNPPRKVHFIMDWDRFQKKLILIYGQNGKMLGFNLSRLGNDGGFNTVLKSVADRMIEEFASAVIHSEICGFWDSLTMDEQFSAIKEYVDTFGHLFLPEEVIENRAPRIGFNFHNVLKEHPRMIKRTRDVGRRF